MYLSFSKKIEKLISQLQFFFFKLHTNLNAHSCLNKIYY